MTSAHSSDKESTVEDQYRTIRGMRVKSYKMRSLTVKNGKQAFKYLDLEFEGTRAYVVWDSVPVGSYQLKARLEIDPALLMKSGGRGCDFFYHGALVLPRPDLN